MAENNNEECSAGEILNMQLKEILVNIAYSMEEEGATEGDVGKLVFENDHYGFSVTVVKK